MSNGPEEFENLRKLLRFKRHEQPPPGYFNHFSSRVIRRIEARGERAAVWGEASWLRKLFALLETNPVAAGLFGVSVCGLLLSGIAYSQHRMPDYSSSSNLSFEVADSGTAVPGAEWTKSAWADSAAPSTMPMFSTNVPGTLFGGIQQVNFTVGH